MHVFGIEGDIETKTIRDFPEIGSYFGGTKSGWDYGNHKVIYIENKRKRGRDEQYYVKYMLLYRHQNQRTKIALVVAYKFGTFCVKFHSIEIDPAYNVLLSPYLDDIKMAINSKQFKEAFFDECGVVLDIVKRNCPNSYICGDRDQYVNAILRDGVGKNESVDDIASRISDKINEARYGFNPHTGEYGELPKRPEDDIKLMSQKPGKSCWIVMLQNRINLQSVGNIRYKQRVWYDVRTKQVKTSPDATDGVRWEMYMLPHCGRPGGWLYE